MNLRSSKHRRLARRTAPLATLALTAAFLVNWSIPTAQAATSTSITVDGSGTGRTFDGVGAISGGGGNTRLLIDYPEPQRSQILDYLFKPNYGASLQTLKIEIGGDTNSTNGSEPSFQHTEGKKDCNEGYEWWLAKEAKDRNPGIKLGALAWGAPGWVGDGGNTFWTAKARKYLLDWMGCAKDHDLKIDYLGGWNEKGFDKKWYQQLRSDLDDNGYGSTKVVAADDTWDVANAMTTDSDFNKAVDIVGTHYPCGYVGAGAAGNGSANTDCNSTSNAQNLSNKPLWASENGSQDAEGGAMAVARAVNRDYIDGRMTAYYNWPLIAGLYPNGYFAFNGLAVANQPWSGHYSIAKTAWVLGHTTQFAQVGWQYLDAASGYLGGNRSNGSYVTLKSPNGSDYSTVIETVDAKEEQTLSVNVTNGLSTGQVHVWATNLRSPYGKDHFQRTTGPSGGRYTLTLKPGYVYTVTTTTGGGKGSTAASPASAPMAMQSNNFETPAATTSPKFFTDMNGAFRTVACDGRDGTCLRQMAATTPVRWSPPGSSGEKYYAPYTFMGDDSWGNYTVKADAMLEQSGAVELLGRVGMQGRNNKGLEAYRLRVSDTGEWSILKSDKEWTFTTLKSGRTTAVGTKQWHTIELTMQGSTISAKLDGATLGSVTDTSYSRGRAGLGTVDSTSTAAVSGYQTQQFDNFSVTPGNNPIPTRSGAVRSGLAGNKCLDLDTGNTANGTPVQLYDCNGWPRSQTWTYNANGTLTIGGKCLDVADQGVTNGSSVQIWDCNGGDNQKWTQQADGSLRGVQSGRCLDVPYGSTDNRTRLHIWDCLNEPANQRWTLP